MKVIALLASRLLLFILNPGGEIQRAVIGRRIARTMTDTSSRLGELLLKGWKMLAESCDACQVWACPLFWRSHLGGGAPLAKLSRHR